MIVVRVSAPICWGGSRSLSYPLRSMSRMAEVGIEGRADNEFISFWNRTDRALATNYVPCVRGNHALDQVYYSLDVLPIDD